MLKYFKNCEFNRKLVHLTSLTIPILYYFVNKFTAVCGLLILFIIVSIWEFLRIKFYLPITIVMNKIFLREKESQALSGAFYFILSSLLAVILFSKYICILSLSILVISDTMAAYIGMKYGRCRIFSKTIEGSLAFFISGLFVIFIVNLIFNYHIINIIAIFALIITTFAELFSQYFKIDDNLLIVLVFGGCYYLFF